MSRLTGLPAKMMAEQFKLALEAKGYSFFENGDHNLNIVGVRNDSGDASKFDDFINVLYKVDGEWVCDAYPVTTEPGTNILRMPIKAVRHKGTAILVPDQYRSTYKIDWHGNKTVGHMALCQRGGKVRVWRDNNRDEAIDYRQLKLINQGYFGINIHRSNPYDQSYVIGKWSAGCQVFQRVDDFNEFMQLCRDSAELYGNSFTYTLLTEQELRKHLE